MVSLVEFDPSNESATQLLESYFQSASLNFLLGSGASFPAIKTAGSIENDLNDLILIGDEEKANSTCLDFVDSITDVHRSLNSTIKNHSVEGVLTEYKRFASLLDGILFARKSQSLPRQGTVFTTNYDLFLEHAAAQLPGMRLNDGFDRSAGLGGDFKFAPEQYFDRTYRTSTIYGKASEIPTINLVKLHGSLTWGTSTTGVVFKSILEPRLDDAKRGDADLVLSELKKHFLILPTLRKFHQTLMERTYYDLLRLYAKALEQENAVMIAFGFSFADEHILDLTRRSLRNPTAQLIIVSFDQPSVAGYQAKFANHRNVTILAPTAGATVDFARLNNILQAVLAEAPK
ncbi:hypothetical protein PMI01_00228 [Caulobacter sp. AP07]|uniref:SIR2 family protein n=1 Tax=Caulobacter sp. AP07 TaxID=1144304 RepID=UPI00027200FC|nr:SIR2 family protein [Caulobacter sp. AP07]EJL38159.1 hypothetical protein PMI01_00228 [Caulobacter sp. AP07]